MKKEEYYLEVFRKPVERASVQKKVRLKIPQGALRVLIQNLIP
jgi:hypothetical protein